MASLLAVVTTWVGVLSRSGLIHSEREEAGVVAASKIVGEERLSALRAFLIEQPEERIISLRATAIELCIWMAVSDRVVDPRERGVLIDLVERADLPAAETTRLIELSRSALSDIRKLSHLETLAERADHPVLRELLLAMTWHIALADDFIDDLELKSFDRLAAIFGVEPADAGRIRDALES